MNKDSKENKPARHDLYKVTAFEFFADPLAAQLADAALKGKVEKVAELVKQGADVHARGKDKEGDALCLLKWMRMSSRSRNKKGLMALLQAGASPVNEKEKYKLLLESVDRSRGKDTQILQAMLDAGFDVNMHNPSSPGQTLLFDTIWLWQDAHFYLLLERGANVNEQETSGDGDYPLHHAARCWQWQYGDEYSGDYILPLLEAGADPLARNKKGHTFQYYLLGAPKEKVTGRFLKNREKVKKWLQENGFEIEENLLGQETQQAQQTLKDQVEHMRKVMEKRDYEHQNHAERITSFLCLIDPEGIDGAMKEYTNALEDFNPEYEDDPWANEDTDWLDFITDKEDIAHCIFGRMFIVGTHHGPANGCYDCVDKLDEMRGPIDWGWGDGNTDHEEFYQLCDKVGITGLLSIATRDLKANGHTLWVLVDEDLYKKRGKDFISYGEYFGWITDTKDDEYMQQLSQLLCEGKVKRFEDTIAYKTGSIK